MLPRLLLLLVFSMVAVPAAAAPVIEPTPTRDVGALITDKGLLQADAAGLLILATEPYDRVVVGLEGADGTMIATCDESGLGIECIRAIAHPLPPGHLDVTVVRGEVVWAGSLLLIGGDVAVLDVEGLLRLVAGTQRRELDEYDFNAEIFRSKLAGRTTLDDKVGYCRRVLAGLSEGDDRDLVAEACNLAAREQAIAEAEAADDAEEILEDEILDTPRTDPNLPLLYHPDGRPRLLPRGTVPRRVAVASAAAGVGASIGAALAWEAEAQKTYLSFREAERLGDDPSMTLNLFLTRNNDLKRDVAIGVGVGLTITAFSFVAHQLFERRAFRRAKEQAEAEAKLEGTP